MILVTGAEGFLGRSVVARLRSSGRWTLSIRHGAQFLVAGDAITMELESEEHVERLLAHCDGVEAIVHLAARVRIDLVPGVDGDPRPAAGAARFADLYASNVTVTARLLEVAARAGIPHVVFASSQTVYGLPANSRVTEEAPLAPLEHYANSKVACETALALWARGHGRRATLLRCPGLWGGDRASGLVHNLCRSAIETKRLRVGSEFPLPIDVLHRDDAATAFVAALGRSGPACRAYNVATGELCSLPLLAEDVAHLVPGCRVETFGVAQPEIALVPERASTELGWSAAPRRERLAAYLASLVRGAPRA